MWLKFANAFAATTNELVIYLLADIMNLITNMEWVINIK